MNKKLITSFVSAALVCSMGMSGVSAVTPVPTMHNNNQVTATSLSRSVADYKKIEGINDQTVLGADFTHYQQDLEWGKTYYNYKSVKIDNLFKFVQGQGINTISVKVAVNPDTSSDKTKCYTLDSAIKTIKAAKEAGLKTNITLFYSDDVTYANSQQLPAGWTQDNAVEKATDYTKEVLNTLSKNDALPTMMTIGNEVNYNFLGLTEDGGWDGLVAMATISKLINEKGVKTALSFAAPDDAEGIQYVIEKLGYAGVDYSYLGVNLYADRNGINDYVKTLRTTVKEKAADKQLIVSNIKFPRKNADETASTETQADSIYNLLSASISDSNAGGLIYDEAEYVGSWNGFFNEQGLAQTSLAVFGFAQGWNIDIDSYRDPYEYGDDTGLKEKNVTINKISNMSESTIRGVDVGSYVALTNAGVKYYDYDGKEQPLMKILKDNGVNYIRLRIWNDPYNEKGETYGGGDSTVDNGLKIGKEATKYGMKVLVDFHYSDFWADPAKQILPKAWQKDANDPDKMCENIHDFTKDTLQKFKDAGVDVGMVQVGNEITKGMAGIHNKDSNNSVWKNESQYSVLDRYLNAGSKAVREILPDALVTLHIETPNRQIYSMIMDAWEKGNVDYDVLGSSYYPFWWNTPNMLRDVQTLAKERGKLFAVMETAWVNSYEDGDGTPNSIGSDYGLYQYEIGPQGQVDELTDMYKVLTEQDNGLGGFYWEPGWIPVKAGWTNWEYNKEVADKYGTGWASKGAVGYAPDDEMYYNGQPSWGGSSWDNATLFDIQGNALQSLKFYKDTVSLGKVQTTRINIVNKEKEVLKTEYVNVNVGDTKTITLPKVNGYYASKGNYNYTVKGDTDGVKTVTVTYNHSTEANLVYVDGDWYLMQDGQVVHETTLAQVNGTGTWYYVEDGKVNKDFNGLFQYGNDWYYIEKGAVNSDYTGLAQYNDQWFYIEKGKLNWDYTGLAQHNNYWFYVEKGRLNWNYSGIVEYNNQWFYVQKGRLNWNYSGLGQSGNEWYYIVRGRVNWNYTGLAQYNDQWFYIEKGKLNWNYTGLAQYKDYWFYVENGRLNWNYTGLVQKGNEWFYVENGRLNWNYSGIVEYNNQWFYVQKGRLNWNYSGLGQSGNEWYYIVRGRVNWNYTGLAQYNDQWFYIEKGKLNWNYTGLVQKGNEWFYVENGRLNWNYTGLAQYNNQWFYIGKGRLDWNYTGIAYHDNQRFYIINGRLDWNYSGRVRYKGKTYTVKNGRVL